MSFVAGLLTAVLVLDSLFLILLILVQLPKKEAGVGQAFGGGATDALFGAGTGNALTNMTKYAAGIFLTLCLVLYIMGGQARKTGSGVRDALKKEQAGSVLPPKAPAPAALTAPPGIAAEIYSQHRTCRHERPGCQDRSCLSSDFADRDQRSCTEGQHASHDSALDNASGKKITSASCRPSQTP